MASRNRELSITPTFITRHNTTGERQGYALLVYENEKHQSHNCQRYGIGAIFYHFYIVVS